MNASENCVVPNRFVIHKKPQLPMLVLVTKLEGTTFRDKPGNPYKMRLDTRNPT